MRTLDPKVLVGVSKPLPKALESVVKAPEVVKVNPVIVQPPPVVNVVKVIKMQEVEVIEPPKEIKSFPVITQPDPVVNVVNVIKNPVPEIQEKEVEKPKQMSFLSNLLKPKEGGTFIGNLTRGIGINKSPVPTAATVGKGGTIDEIYGHTQPGKSSADVAGQVTSFLNLGSNKVNTKSKQQTARAGFDFGGGDMIPMIGMAVILILLLSPKSSR